MTTRLLLVDDHAVVRSGLRMLLENEREIEIVGEAGNAAEAIEAATRLKPNLILMDIGLPDLSGIDATREIKKRLPEVSIVALTIHEDEEYFFKMLEAGASGYVPKRAAPEELLTAIRAAVLNELGEKMSKRNGAKPVTQYRDEGYLPEALVNYLARLGWSHGDDEIFSRAQFVEWFNLDHLGRSAAQFDDAKLRWVNAQHLKAMDDTELARLVAKQLQHRNIEADDRLPAICALFKDRCDTLLALAHWAAAFYAGVTPDAEEKARHVTDAVRPALAQLAQLLETCEWTREAIGAAIKSVLAEQGLKMPQLAMPVRVLVMGTAQTPSLDAVLALSTREKVLECLRAV